MQTVDIYIDTSIKGPRRRDGTCWYIIAYKAANGETADTGSKIHAKDTTENQLTLIGLETALKRLKAPCQLILHLECNHVAARGPYRESKMSCLNRDTRYRLRLPTTRTAGKRRSWRTSSAGMRLRALLWKRQKAAFPIPTCISTRRSARKEYRSFSSTAIIRC